MMKLTILALLLGAASAANIRGDRTSTTDCSAAVCPKKLCPDGNSPRQLGDDCCACGAGTGNAVVVDVATQKFLDAQTAKKAASDAASEATEASARSKRKAGFTGIQGVLDKLSKFIADERGRVDREHKHDVDTARKQMEKEHAAQDLRLLREQQRLQGIVDRKTAVSLA
jgi:hypothetical protein